MNLASSAKAHGTMSATRTIYTITGWTVLYVRNPMSQSLPLVCVDLAIVRNFSALTGYEVKCILYSTIVGDYGH